jgi:hypothetical protein
MDRRQAFEELLVRRRKFIVGFIATMDH